MDKKQQASEKITVSTNAESSQTPQPPDPGNITVSTDAPQTQQTVNFQQESFYAQIPDTPTQKGPEGIRFDFCNGLRVVFPKNGRHYHVAFADLDSENIIFASDTQPGTVAMSNKKYFVRFRLMIFHKGEMQPFFTHDYDAKGKPVFVQVPGDTLGDSIGWFSYAERFQEKHDCELYVIMRPQFIELFQPQYPKLHLITKEQAREIKPYASYQIGLFWNCDNDNQPKDHRWVGNHRTAGWILGVDPSDIPPRVDLSAPRIIQEPYVVIACQASTQCKYWNNPGGWRSVIQFLHENGYKIVCCDRSAFAGTGIVWNQMPWGVDIDDTGDKPLKERIDIFKDADFFVGLPSGLAWIAWMCRIPVVMISGMSDPVSEFETPYRVINYQVCHSCWNDFRYNFDHQDFLWCPRHKGTDRQFECSRMISAKMVIDAIKRIPQFQAHAAAMAKAQVQPEKSEQPVQPEKSAKKAAKEHKSK